MKKYIVCDKWKLHLLRRSKAEQKKRERRYLRKFRITQLVASTPRHKDKFNRLEAPKVFSVIDNHDEMLQYFHLAREKYKNREQVDFDLSKIDEMTPDAIATLVACVHDKGFSRGLNAKGNSPAEPELRKMFTESGFYSYMHSNWAFNPGNPKHLLLHRVTKNKVENDIAKQACQRAVYHVFNNDIIFSPMYEILIECMANTNNHAGLNLRGKYDWWLFEYCDPSTNSTKVTFLDLGVGIFRSLSVQNYIRTAMTNLGLVDNIDLMPKLLSGDISSRTRLKYRGRGLPLIHNHSKHGNIKLFYIISNDVFADVKNGKYIKTKCEFGGTMRWPPIVGQF